MWWCRANSTGDLMATLARFLIANSAPKLVLSLALVFPLSLPGQKSSATSNSTEVVSAEQFSSEVTGFLGKELAAHVADIRSFDPPQERVVGVLTTGEFSWGTFLRALAS